MKIAKEPLGDTVDPDIDRDGIPEFTEDTLAFLREGIPEMAEGKVVGGRSCLYTATPDDHFMVDRVPQRMGIRRGRRQRARVQVRWLHRAGDRGRRRGQA